MAYQQIIPYNQSMATSDLMANPIIYKPMNANIESSVSPALIHANLKYIDIPSHKIADGVTNTATLIIHDEDLIPASDKLVKEKLVTKDALIYFKVNLAELDWKLDLNKKNTLAVSNLNDFINKGLQIKSIDVDGFASPEGEESFNQGLSAQRAITGKKYLVDMFKKWSDDVNATQYQKNIGAVTINTASHGEDWDGFMMAVQASDMKDKLTLINVINSQPDLTKREMEMRNMTHVFKVLAEDILPPLRRVNIKITSYEPVRTDPEFLCTATSNPEPLTLEELLYSATLTNNYKTQLGIYKFVMTQYNLDWRAFNNAGIIVLVNGDAKVAESYLSTANTLSPNNVIVLNNLGAAEAKLGNMKSSIELFKKAQGLGADEKYNLGIPQITLGNYNEAVIAFNAKKCNYNLGLAQLLSGNSQVAIVTLKCAPESASVYYLLAIAAARTNDSSMLYVNLKKSINLDNNFKAKAANDREFIRFFTVPEFQMIVKQ